MPSWIDIIVNPHKEVNRANQTQIPFSACHPERALSLKYEPSMVDRHASWSLTAQRHSATPSTGLALVCEALAKPTEVSISHGSAQARIDQGFLHYQLHAYRPSAELEKITRELGFSNKNFGLGDIPLGRLPLALNAITLPSTVHINTPTRRARIECVPVAPGYDVSIDVMVRAQEFSDAAMTLRSIGYAFLNA